MPYEASDRPFPTGGSGHDLELYLTVNRCGGLERGIYQYDPLGHRLHLLHNREEDIGAMLRESRVSTGGLGPPDVLITVTSRFQRLGWKYDSIAYATTLRNVGVLYQTMYLVATAMGLAPCALGGGDCEVAGRALGLELTKESSVGDFMLGSLPDPERFAGERARWSSQADLWRPANDAEWMRIRERVIRRRES
jgi:SagB-type dehydrogenase family enzyme